MELRTANAASIQKQTVTASLSQCPARFGPYWEILRRMVPNDTTEAGMNSRSVGCRIEALNVSG